MRLEHIMASLCKTACSVTTLFRNDGGGREVINPPSFHSNPSLAHISHNYSSHAIFFLAGFVFLVVEPDWEKGNQRSHGKEEQRAAERGPAEDVTNWRILLGKHNLNYLESTQRSYRVKRIYQHEHFHYPQLNDLEYDIALVKSVGDITANRFIHYACLPKRDSFLHPGHSCWVTGWGGTRGGKENFTLSEVLNQANLPVIDFNTCHHKKFWGAKIQSSMLCAGVRDTTQSPAACQGDSGGPLLCQMERDTWEVHGIVSFGPVKCQVQNKPTVFTRTSAYIPWIEAVRKRDYFFTKIRETRKA
ncbi:hypothetical protein JD844_006225 [Phrynosoma platyrhinos]|uniref:Peptidase S1 domain-containing protein n=1 Tax=Phrynosoma platyrhinos TaxID=52577 RepID=A0ABQ7T1T8_PHRPL|nr:hypothetical protein JD844_006225 [Phrynosoma platyrhinos]